MKASISVLGIMNNLLAVSISAAILVIIIISMVWFLFIDTSINYVYAYGSGLVTLLTPCSLPILLVVTSFAIKQKHSNALLTSISFSIGIIVFSALLGLVLSAVGIIIDLPKISNVLFMVGGIIGYMYVLNELFELRIPMLGLKIPNIKRSSYIIAFITGLLLALGDIGCPNPFRYVLLSFIVASGELFNGTVLGLLYGLGSITPLLLITFLALLGINLTSSILRHSNKLEKAINITFLPIGAFLITFGIVGEEWYESTIIHDIWESILLQYNLLDEHSISEEADLGNIIFLLLIATPLLIKFAQKALVRLLNP